MLNSLFMHQTNQNGLISHMICLFLLVECIVIALNVITSGNWASTTFLISYSVKDDFTSDYYQKADSYFSYAYMCTAFLLITVLQMNSRFIGDIGFRVSLG